MPELDTKIRYAVEVRHSSWFRDLAYNFFANNDICLVWSQLAELQTPPILRTDFLYVRLIGDRSIEEKDFGRIPIDRALEVQKWADNIKAVEDERIKPNLKRVRGFVHSEECYPRSLTYHSVYVPTKI